MKNLSTIKKIITLAVFACLLSFPLAHSGEGEAISGAEEAISGAEKDISGAEKANSSEGEAISEGEKLYFKKGCDVCHGYVGQGWLGGKRLAEPVLPLAAFKTLVRRPNGSMPPFSPSVLSESELEAIHEYIASLKSPDAKDIPLLQLDN